VRIGHVRVGWFGGGKRGEWKIVMGSTKVAR